MTVGRVSKGRFDLNNLDQAERLLAASEQALRPPLRRLPGGKSSVALSSRPVA